MPLIDILEFGGEMPRVTPKKLPLKAAALAENVRLYSGDIEAWRDLAPVSATLHSVLSPEQSIFKYGSHWFSWISDVDAIYSPIANDTYDRVYYTGDGYPKVTSNLIATGGDPKPQLGYRLGVPAPDAAISISAVNGADPDADDFSDDETRFYVYTYVTEYGEEGPPSPPSTQVELKAPSVQTVDIGVPSPGTNTQNITHKRIYRTASDGGATDYYLVAELPLATASFTDDVTADALSILLETEGFEPPPSDMQGLVMGTNGIAAGFDDNEVLFSEPYLPYAWPFAYRQSTEFPVVGVQPTTTGFVVATEGNPYLFLGVNPSSITVRKLDVNQACVSKRSMVDMGRYVIYASPDGLVAAGERNAELITMPIITKREWAAFQPETIHAYRYQDKYVAFYGDASGFVFDPETGDFYRLDFYASAGFSDLLTDTLYLVVDRALYAWDSAETLRPYTWRSRVYRTPVTALTSMKVYTDDLENVAVKVFRDGKQILSLGSLQREAFRLPTGRGELWQVEISGTAAVERVALGYSFAEFD